MSKMKINPKLEYHCGLKSVSSDFILYEIAAKHRNIPGGIPFYLALIPHNEEPQQWIRKIIPQKGENDLPVAADAGRSKIRILAIC